MSMQSYPFTVDYGLYLNEDLLKRIALANGWTEEEYGDWKDFMEDYPADFFTEGSFEGVIDYINGMTGGIRTINEFWNLPGYVDIDTDDEDHVFYLYMKKGKWNPWTATYESLQELVDDYLSQLRELKVELPPDYDIRPLIVHIYGTTYS